MSIHGTWTPHTAAIHGIEVPRRLLRQACQNPSDNWQTGCNEIDGQEQARLPTGSV